MSNYTFEEKLIKLKEFAVSWGICKACFRKPLIEGRTRCAKCIGINRVNAARKRKAWDRCSRCGGKLSKLDIKLMYKTCVKRCRNKNT
jgi:hypothetical protein